MVWEGVKLAQYAWFHVLFLCLWFLFPKQSAKLVHILRLQFHRRMHILIHCDRHAGMAKDLRKAFDIKIKLHTAGSKSMAGGVEVCILYTAFLQNPLEAVLHHTRFYKPILISGQKKGILLIMLF